MKFKYEMIKVSQFHWSQESERQAHLHKISEKVPEVRLQSYMPVMVFFGEDDIKVNI